MLRVSSRLSWVALAQTWVSSQSMELLMSIKHCFVVGDEVYGRGDKHSWLLEGIQLSDQGVHHQCIVWVVSANVSEERLVVFIRLSGERRHFVEALFGSS